MTFRLYAGDLLSGRIRAEVDAASASWTVALNDAGSIECTVPRQVVRDLDLFTIAEPARTFLAIAYVDADDSERMLQAGPVWKHAWDDDAGTLRIGAAGMWSYFDHRFVLPVLSSDGSPALVASTWTDKTLGTIASRLVRLAQLATGGAVPVLEAEDTDGTATRTYDGFQLKTIGSALADLTAVDDGPDLEFLPERDPGDGRVLRWQLRAGTPLLTQWGDDHLWDTTAAQAPITGITVSRDGTAMASRAYVQGDGVGMDTLFGSASDARLIAAGFPYLEAADSSHASGTVLRATLDGYASEILARGLVASQTWGCTVRADEHPVLGTYRPGDWARIVVAGNDYLRDGEYRTRITGFSGDLSEQVKMQFQVA